MNQVLCESEDILELPKLKELLSQYAVSDLGKELILSLKPTCDIGQLEKLLEICSEVKGICLTAGSLPLNGFVDIRPTLERASIIGAILEPGELVSIANCAAASRNCKSFILKQKQKLPLLSQIAHDLPTFVELETSINSCISPEGEILDSASDELRKIRRQTSKLREKIREKLESMLHSSQYQKLIQEPLITLRNDRYVIPVKQDYKGMIQGVVQGQSGSGATLFFEPISIVEMNNDLHKLQYEESREIRRILAALSQKVNSEATRLKEAISLLAEVDLNLAKARFSVDLRCSKPILNSRGYTNLTKARHPLLEFNLKQKAQMAKRNAPNALNATNTPDDNSTPTSLTSSTVPTEVVPIDLHIGDEFDTLVITGPNTGGKTVALKTVGLLTLMAQCGLQIPAADGSEIGVFKGIYADIGDEQSIEQNLSTFSSHISRIIKILNQIDDNSLVLLDEIGAGTDPTEGAALAMAILDYLRSKGSKNLVTTHYGVLKAYAQSAPNMKNASVEFDWLTLQPTYRLQVGVPGSSNALKIADRIGLSKQIIEGAKSYIDERTIEVEDLIASMEKERKKLQKELIEAENKAFAATQSQITYDRLLAQLKAERQTIRRQAEQEVSELIRTAKKLLEDTIAQIKKEQASKASILQAYRAVNEIQKELTSNSNNSKTANSTQPQEPQLSSENLELGELKIGDLVVVKSLNKTGEIVALPDSKGDLSLRIGNVKVAVPVVEIGKLGQVNISDISDKNDKRASNISSLNSLSYSKKSKLSANLNVQGMSVQEALESVDKYLDDALLASLDSIFIVHGKGTGALKNAIRQLLKDQSFVESFKPGELNEGGDGVTIVKLKD